MTATLSEAPELRGRDRVRDSVGEVIAVTLLPFVYATWWFGRVARELRALGRDCRDAQLVAASPARAWLGMAFGWILVVPATVVIMTTARRAQHAERVCTGTERPVTGVVAAVVAAQVAGLACALAGVAILVPFALLFSGIVAVAILQPRLNQIWEISATLPVRENEIEHDPIPLVPPSWTRAWNRMSGHDWVETAAAWAGLLALFGAAAAVYALGQFLAAEDRTGPFAGTVTAVCLTALLVGASLVIGSALRQLADRRWTPFAPDGVVVAVALLSAVTAAAWLWDARPAFHGLLMPLYQWPLVTWIPLVLGLAFTAVLAAAGRGRTGIVWRTPVTVAVWCVLMTLLPGWQDRALYDATVYVPTDLPRTTQPRLLPKVAALAFASDASLRDAHLVVDPSSDRLVWSAEVARGAPRFGPSAAVRELALDSVEGRSHTAAGGFDPAVSRVGPGSLQWRAYDRHWLTRVQDAVLVPGVDGEAVAVAPYLRYTGFPVRHPVWAGVYVYHQDGRLEDLTPQQALARPELAQSGRLYPERLARAVADADRRTEVSDPSGNPQPYLTNLGDHEERWVTVAHSPRDSDTASAVFLTDSATGRTGVWTPPGGTRLLSNSGAASLAHRLPLQWDTTDDDGDTVWMRKVVEPTPVFASGRLYYLVSIVPNHDYVHTSLPVEETVVVDAARRRIAKRFDNADPEASAALLHFFNP
jgi:hypothetical protein